MAVILAIAQLGWQKELSHAGTINLSGAPMGTMVSGGNGTFFQKTDMKKKKPEEFLTTQNDNDVDGVVSAFNGAGPSIDNLDAIFNGNKTHPIILDSVPTTTDNRYRVFVLDVNQNQSQGDEYIVIEDLKVYLIPNNTMQSFSSIKSQAPIYDLSAMANFAIKVNGDVGLGKGDMLFFLPNNFDSTQGDSTVYLSYKYTNYNDGPEMWYLDYGVRYSSPDDPDPNQPPHSPEPTTIAIWSIGAILAKSIHKRRTRRETE